MASNIIEVNTGSLKGDVSEIAAELEKIRGGVSQLMNILGQLETMWEGSAKQAFSAAVRDDVGRLQTLVKAMQVLTNKTSDARAEYDKCENLVAQIVASIKV